ncbi:MAG: BACON domain-containing protein, partial [Gammaproteobacteria bacterium]|nr:BACON domain-containing protein [Gammaproteobacteria bacterium]
WGNCILSISANSNSFTSTGGSGSFSVTAPAGCGWSPVDSDSWITLTSGADSGNGTVSYSVAENTGVGARSGSITVGGQTYNITQQGADILPKDFCNVNVVSDLAENASVSHEACEVLVIGPSFTTEDGSSVDLNSGLEILFMPGTLMEQGATLNANVCGQSLCEISPSPMPYGCHSCVDQICDMDPDCCETAFDQTCLEKVDVVCGLVCE